MQINEKTINELKTILVDPLEKIIGVVGNKMIEKFIATRTLGNGFAVLTDRRVYFKGKNYSRKGKRFYKTTEEQTVNIENVTGTRFIHRNPLWLKALYIVCFVLAIIFAVFAGLYFICAITGGRWFYNYISDFILFAGVGAALYGLGKLLQVLYKAKSASLFEICFAGGGIAFGLNWIDMSEAEEFQKLIQKTKDEAIKKDIEERKADIKLINNKYNSSADEIVKFKKLFDDGIISYEEFEAKKKELLGL